MSHAAVVVVILFAVAAFVALCVTGLRAAARPDRSSRRNILTFVVTLGVVAILIAAAIALFLWANWSSITG